MVYYLYATFPSEEKITILLEGVGPCLFYGNKIVYFKSVPKDERVVVHDDDDVKQIKSQYSGDIYVMNPDGANNHILIHTDEFITGTTVNRAHPQICGDYIGIIAGNFDGDNMLNNKLIIDNINNGEFVVTHD